MNSADTGIAAWFWMGVISHVIASRKAKSSGIKIEGIRFYQICYWIVFFGWLWKLCMIESGTLMSIKWSFVAGLLVLATVSWFKRQDSPHWRIIIWIAATMGIANLVMLVRATS